MSVTMFVARRLVRRELSSTAQSLVLTKERREAAERELEERGLTVGDLPLGQGPIGDAIRFTLL